MHKEVFAPAVALVAASALLLTGCSGSENGSGNADAAPRACVILPDSDSSNRWENGDRPALQEAFEAEGFEVDIQNAQNDTSRYATIADQQLSQGCGVFILVDLQGAGIQVATNARSQGIPVIAYDRPIEGADYYVSFDNVEVGRLMGQSVLDGLEANGVDPATASVVFSGGDPADGNAGRFLEGASEVLESAGVEPAFETVGTWVPEEAGTAFEQAYTALQGAIDAVWVANDNNAAAVIAILDKNGKTVPVSGQDATPAGLQNVLLGKQTATIYKPFQLEADATVELAVQLLNGETPDIADEIDGVPFIGLDAIPIYAEDVVTVIEAGDANLEDVCTPELAEACAQYGIQ